MWLNRIQVTKVEADQIHGIGREGRMVRLSNLNNTVVIRPGLVTPEIN
jgi:hypothetical protein